MSDKASEYLKRTCLICGCHTNQTINIYEPRSGPNIVELIQAKFKFQPLNEDKYLCYSCNNWLINWHSLQALNSNDAESPSGTFRSHLNNMAQEERGAGSQHATPAGRVRPVAQVRPFQLVEAEDAAAAVAAEAKAAAASTTTAAPVVQAEAAKSSRLVYHSNRSYRLNHRLRPHRGQYRSLQTCCLCGRAIVVRVKRASTLRSAATRTAKCRQCREVSAWRALHLRSLAKTTRLAAKAAHVKPQRRSPLQTKDDANQRHERQLAEQQQQQQRTLLQRPLVDGKVVAMLRRLGTTLSRDESGDGGDTAATKVLPPIMSPAKQRPLWTRPLADDEILLDFDTAISEVLPSVVDTSSRAFGSRRKLTFQDSHADVIELSDCEQEDREEADREEDEAEVPRMNIYDLLLPRRLSISLVSN